MSSRQQQSRRSACERCRKYKLRCERDPRRGGTCERCHKTSIPCVAGFPPRSSVHRLVSIDSHDPTSERSTSERQQRMPCGPESSRYATPSMSNPVPACSAQGTFPGWGESYDHEDVSNQTLALESLLSPMSMDLGFGRHPLLENGGAQLAGRQQQDITTRQQQKSSSGDHRESAELGDSLFGSLSPEENVLMMAVPQNHLQELFELCAQLAEDSKSDEYLDDYSNLGFASSPISTETAVQRLLERSSRFCDLLARLAEAEAQPRRHEQPQEPDQMTEGAANPATSAISSSYGVGSPPVTTTPTPTPRRENCVILTTTLITAYIMLIRKWRHIFSLLYRLLLDSSTSQSDICALPVLMPSLQLGGFHVRNNPNTQIAVLLELSAEMILQIETGLRIDGSLRNEHSQNNVAGSGGKLQQRSLELYPEGLIKEPVAISIRDTLLLQEQLHLSSQEGIDGLPLRDIMSKLKERLNFGTRRLSDSF